MLSKLEEKMGVANIQKGLMGIKFAEQEQVDVKAFLFRGDISTALPTDNISEGFILICHGGTALFSYSDRQFTLHARDMITIFPGDIYSLTDISTGFTASWVSFSKQIKGVVLQDFPTSFYSHIAGKPIYNLSDNEQYDSIMEYLKLLHRRLSDQNNICRYQITFNLLCSLMMEVLNIVAHNLQIERSEPKHRQQILDEFISRVNSTPRCREVAYFAQLLDIAPKPLSAIVADGTGFTAKEYIERTAIATIKQLLSTTSLTVKEIAERLDYSGSGNLCRFFKTNTGVTISEFKQSLKR